MADSYGFPARPSRAAFGPIVQDRWPARNPKFETPAAVGNLMFAQIAGAGLTAVLAWLMIKTTTAPSVALLERLEAWNPDGLATGAYASPNVVRASAGVLDITYPAQVPDFQGTLRPLTFRGGIALYLDDDATKPLSARVIPDMSGGAPAFSSHVKIRGWQHNGAVQTPLDGTFLIGLV